MKRFIVDPNAVAPGSEMPPYEALARDDLEALMVYLETLK